MKLELDGWQRLGIFLATPFVLLAIFGPPDPAFWLFLAALVYAACVGAGWVKRGFRGEPKE